MRYRVIYDETARQMKCLGWWGKLDVSGVRRAMSGPYRYCLQDTTFYLPKDTSVLDDGHRLCWGSVREEDLEDYPWLIAFDEEVPENPLLLDCPFGEVGFGVNYSRRHREAESGRIQVSSFIAQSVLDEIDENPQVMTSLSKTAFEELVAELFARMGFEVDLLRPVKDDGIDFLAVRKDDNQDPIILAVQTKHPNPIKPARKRATMSVTTVREVYGVAKAWDLAGAVAISSSEYSRDAKRFADMKPREIAVNSGEDVLHWVRRYRWNCGE